MKERKKNEQKIIVNSKIILRKLVPVFDQLVCGEESDLRLESLLANFRRLVAQRKEARPVVDLSKGGSHDF